jgi:NAD(P) transhydrogenase
VRFFFNDKYIKVEVDEAGNVHTTLASGPTLVTDKFLFATGRSGASRNLGLEALGIEINNRGHIAVNENYQTAVPNIYAAGDVIGFPALASTSMEQGRLAMCHAFNLTYKKKLASILPYGIYTVPEISMAGLTEEEVKELGIDYEVGRAFFSNNARGQIIGDNDGMIKLVFSASNQLLSVNRRVPGAQELGKQQLLVEQQLLGVHVIGELAAELVQVGLGCMYYHGTIDYFIQSVFNFPTLSEAFKYAAYDGLGRLARRQD